MLLQKKMVNHEVNQCKESCVSVGVLCSPTVKSNLIPRFKILQCVLQFVGPFIINHTSKSRIVIKIRYIFSSMEVKYHP